MSDDAPRERPRRKKRAPRSAPADARAVDQPRTYVAIAGACLMFGAALTAVGDLTFGPALDLFALAFSVYAAHRVGRMGPDRGTVRANPLDAEP